MTTSDPSTNRIGSTDLTLRWRVRHQALFLYEIDSDAIAHHVPPGLEALEVRPGRALMALECLHYYAGHFRPDSPEFYEIVLTVATQPDLSLDMPMPRYCMHAISVLSDSQDFVEQEGRLLYTPTELVPGLRMVFSEDGSSCDVLDGDTRFVEMKNTLHPPRFEHRVMYGQYYTHENGLQQGMWRWEGDVFEHQKSGDYGSFGPHAMWKGIDTSRVRACYRQMSARPNIETNVDFYHLGKVSERNGQRR